MLFREILKSCGEKYVIDQARKDGQMRVSGLSAYLKRQRDDAILAATQEAEDTDA